jgi:hypothetical protein
MKRTWLMMLLVASTGVILPGGFAPLEKAGAHCALLYAQSGELPAPGNPGHQRPSPGESCVHNDGDPAHNCSCHRECKQNTDDDGNPTEGASVQEDPKCRVYCFKDHCHCPIENCD